LKEIRVAEFEVGFDDELDGKLTHTYRWKKHKSNNSYSGSSLHKADKV
jgi:hypothetical protein